MELTSTLIQHISELYDECILHLEELKNTQLKYKDNQNTFDNLCIRFEHYKELLKIHLNLESKELVSVNFYSEINSFFNKKTNKRVGYYLYNNDEETFEWIKDKTLLNKCFIVQNCLPIMKLVPMQLASNAYKYMLNDSSLEVELMTIGKRNYLSMKNWGPHCKNEDIKKIFKEGIRGSNINDTVGMGLGLSQVETICDIHKNLLNMTFEIKIGDKIQYIDSIPYSKFCATLTYVNALDSNKEVLPKKFKSFESSLFYMLIHNISYILANMLKICDEFCNIREKENNSWHGNIYKFRLHLNKVQEVITLYQFLDKKEITTSLLGNRIWVKLDSLFKATMKNLCNYIYPDIKCDVKGKLRTKELNSSIYVFVYGMINLILSTINENKDTDILITYEADQIIFQHPDLIELEAYRNVELDEICLNEINSYKFYMYKLIIEFWGGEIIIKTDCLTIRF